MSNSSSNTNLSPSTEHDDYLNELLYECPLCFEPYLPEMGPKEPLVLTECGHSCCRECYDMIMKLGNDQRVCPTCNGSLPLSAKATVNYAFKDILTAHRSTKDTNKLKKLSKNCNETETKSVVSSSSVSHSSTKDSTTSIGVSPDNGPPQSSSPLKTAIATTASSTTTTTAVNSSGTRNSTTSVTVPVTPTNYTVNNTMARTTTVVSPTPTNSLPSTTNMVPRTTNNLTIPMTTNNVTNTLVTTPSTMNMSKTTNSNVPKVTINTTLQSVFVSQPVLSLPPGAPGILPTSLPVLTSPSPSTTAGIPTSNPSRSSVTVATTTTTNSSSSTTTISTSSSYSTTTMNPSPVISMTKPTVQVTFPPSPVPSGQFSSLAKEHAATDCLYYIFCPRFNTSSSSSSSSACPFRHMPIQGMSEDTMRLLVESGTRTPLPPNIPGTTASSTTSTTTSTGTVTTGILSSIYCRDWCVRRANATGPYCPRGDACGFLHPHRRIVQYTDCPDCLRVNRTASFGGNCLYTNGLPSTLRHIPSSTNPVLPSTTTNLRNSTGTGSSTMSTHPTLIQNPNTKRYFLCNTWVAGMRCDNGKDCRYLHVMERGLDDAIDNQRQNGPYRSLFE